MNSKSIPLKNPNIVARKSGKECILVPIINNIADMEAVYTLNETALCVWEGINGENSAGKISDLITGMFEIDSDTALKDTLDLLKDLKLHGIISE